MMASWRGRPVAVVYRATTAAGRSLVIDQHGRRLTPLTAELDEADGVSVMSWHQQCEFERARAETAAGEERGGG